MSEVAVAVVFLGREDVVFVGPAEVVGLALDQRIDWVFVPEDMPLRITAEYGHFTGGVVSAITKSGGNAYSGLFTMRYTNEGAFSPPWRTAGRRSATASRTATRR